MKKHLATILTVILVAYCFLSAIATMEATQRMDDLHPIYPLAYGFGWMFLMLILVAGGELASRKWRSGWYVMFGGVVVLVGLGILELIRNEPPCVLLWRHWEFFQSAWVAKVL